MNFLLGVMAGCIFILYSIYFIRIIRGNPQDFEIEILKALASWIMSNGEASRKQLWTMWAVSFFLEAVYFGLTFLLINNPVMLMLSATMAGMESYHLLSTGLNLRRFFKGEANISKIFNWRIERSSAVLLFTHSLLVLVILIFL